MIVKLRNVRIEFPILFTPKAFNGQGKAAFSAAFIMEKDHEGIKTLQEAIKEVATEKWGAKATETLKKLRMSDDLCLHDGDTKPEYDGFAGNMFLSARSYQKPLVVDSNKAELTEVEGKPYAGCHVHVSVDLWAQDNGFGKRINATLRGVRFYKDGEAFAGGAPAGEDEFDEFDDDEENGDDLF